MLVCTLMSNPCICCMKPPPPHLCVCMSDTCVCRGGGGATFLSAVNTPPHKVNVCKNTFSVMRVCCWPTHGAVGAVGGGLCCSGLAVIVIK